nr:hypothetical protein [Rhodoferax sp. UBA5149]
MNHLPTLRQALLAATSAGAVALLASCASRPLPSAPASPPAPAAPPLASSQSTAPATAPTRMTPISNATSPQDYRRDAATHLYGQNAHRIYHGKMPPLLYAIGVLQVEVDGKGHVVRTNWMRAPSHAPEVVAEIERTVRLAEPYPVPARMGRVTYTDTWLWHSSGRFQLDTLTEGQL